ncbi:Blue copper protein [Sesamum alatum]|uniref:Blue copper protein n=1 Tax=Sesamum alatum TaxID=300844 RepID=A0AAE2CD86_9LAMI|nr:Blue copper protein [Sesamum alatum]
MEVCNRFVPLLVLILAAALSREALAAKHVVGGSQGWDESVDFDSWASGRTFKVGDELEFKYTAGLHSVVELAGESAYKSCDIGSAVDSLNGGSNTVKLSKAGTRYFACGTPGHCEQGMKVKITAVAADGSSTTTPPSSKGSDAPSTSAASAQLHFLGFFALVASLLVSLALFF